MKLIVPLAIAAWLGGMVFATDGVPVVFEAMFIVAFAITVPVVVFYLIGESGWRALAKRFRASTSNPGSWQLCPTGQMALVSVDHPDFHKVKMRFVGGSLSVATSAEALHLSTMFSNLPVLSGFFPRLQIPWSSIAHARAFEAPGWFTPESAPGLLLQAAYDPNYTGKFIEMEAGDAPVFIQLPAWILGEHLGRLPGMTESAW
ncbi:MAG TPA: hypothetical protein VMQ83_05480 [Gammaproteobacteria bacterium]|nr:hypothetical protein [Gammaproteobacteria bacterium]